MSLQKVYKRVHLTCDHHTTTMDNCYAKYYKSQAGGALTNFGPLYSSKLLYQRGRGIGGIFSRIFRFLKPVVASGLNFLKGEAMDTGVDLLRGIQEQKPLKNVLRDRGLQVIDKLRDKAAEKIQSLSGAGIRRRRRNIKKRQLKNYKKMCKT